MEAPLFGQPPGSALSPGAVPAVPREVSFTSAGVLSPDISINLGCVLAPPAGDAARIALVRFPNARGRRPKCQDGASLRHPTAEIRRDALK